MRLQVMSCTVMGKGKRIRVLKHGTRNTELGTGLLALSDMFVKNAPYPIQNRNWSVSENLVMETCNF